MTASQVSAGRKNQLIIETNGAVESVAFDQEHPEDLWRGGRDGADHVVRDPANLTDDARRMSWVSAGHPEGYERCFENFVRDAYAAIRTGVHPVGLPTFADGFRYAQIVDGQCEAELICTARAATWTQVWVWPNTTRHDRPASSRSTLGLSQPSLAQAEVGGLQGRIELPAATAPVLLGVIQFLPERGTTRRHLRNR